MGRADRYDATERSSLLRPTGGQGLRHRPIRNTERKLAFRCVARVGPRDPPARSTALLSSARAFGRLAGRGRRGGGAHGLAGIHVGIVQAHRTVPISCVGATSFSCHGFSTGIPERTTRSTAFDVALHLRHARRVVAYFWREVVSLTVAGVRSLAKRRIDTEDSASFVSACRERSRGDRRRALASTCSRSTSRHADRIFSPSFGVILWLATAGRDLPRSAISPSGGLAIGARRSRLMPGVSRSGHHDSRAVLGSRLMQRALLVLDC